jgi:hypothetical protein
MSNPLTTFHPKYLGKHYAAYQIMENSEGKSWMLFGIDQLGRSYTKPVYFNEEEFMQFNGSLGEIIEGQDLVIEAQQNKENETLNDFVQILGMIAQEIEETFPDSNLQVIEEDNDIYFIVDKVVYDRPEYKNLVDALTYEMIIKNYLSNIYFVYR